MQSRSFPMLSLEKDKSKKSLEPIRTNTLSAQTPRYANLRTWHERALTRTLQPTGPIETTMCDYETVASVNEELFGNLAELVRLPFFKYFQVRKITTIAF